MHRIFDALDQSGAESVQHKLPAAAKLPSTEAQQGRVTLSPHVHRTVHCLYTSLQSWAEALLQLRANQARYL